MPDGGKLIVLEGVDDTVLEAQVGQLYHWLRGQGIAVEQTREPTYGPVGTQIRLFQQGRLQIDPDSLALFGTADRMDHLGREDGILSWLADGGHVLCARYLLFSYAYSLDRVDLNWLRRINARCRRPDLTLFLDIDMAQRACLPPDRSPASDPAMGSTPDLKRLRQNYLTVIDTLRSEGEKIVIVDADIPAGEGSEASAFAACRRHVADLLGL